MNEMNNINLHDMKKHNSTKLSTIILLIIAAVATLTTGCKKLDDGSPEPHKSTGYLVVTCDDCQVQYGMPDQYKQYDVSGTSDKFNFTYEGGYTLVSYITPLNDSKNITLTVYDANNAVVYSGSINQLTTSHWETDVKLPADL